MTLRKHVRDVLYFLGLVTATRKTADTYPHGFEIENLISNCCVTFRSTFFAHACLGDLVLSAAA